MAEGGFRAYISPAHKRKASEIAALAETPANRAGSGHLARNAVGAATECAEVRHFCLLPLAMAGPDDYAGNLHS